MNTKKKPGSESIVREIKRRTRRKYSAEDKIRIVLEGLRGEQSITDLSRRGGSIQVFTTNGARPFLRPANSV